LIINSSGYELKFIQKRISKDDSCHLHTLIYKFYSPKTKFQYIILAEYHIEDVFAVKFYVQQHSKSIYKYSKITNKGDLSNILVTNAKIIPVLLMEYPTASFAFAGARSIDLKSKKVEGYQLNQRFRIYRSFVSDLVGSKTFVHFEYEEISGYLLINKKHENISHIERKIVRMFADTYQDLPDI
jgi:hypothetical protein